MLRPQRAGGDRPAPGRPRGRLQPRLHRTRPAQPTRRGAASAPDPAHRLTDAGGAGHYRGAIGASTVLERLDLNPTRLFPGQRAPGERRRPRFASAGCWICLRAVRDRWRLPVRRCAELHPTWCSPNSSHPDPGASAEVLGLYERPGRTSALVLRERAFYPVRQQGGMRAIRGSSSRPGNRT